MHLLLLRLRVVVRLLREWVCGGSRIPMGPASSPTVQWRLLLLLLLGGWLLPLRCKGQLHGVCALGLGGWRGWGGLAHLHREPSARTGLQTGLTVRRAARVRLLRLRRGSVRLDRRHIDGGVDRPARSDRRGG